MACPPDAHPLSRSTRRRLLRLELLEVFRTRGAAAGDHACRHRLANHPDDLDEISLNYIGYFLLGEGHLDAAVRVFELLIEVFPLSANAHHSLGEAYREAGQMDRAAVSEAMFQCLGPLQGLRVGGPETRPS